MLKIHNERTQCLNMSDEHMFLGHDPILNKDKNKKNIFKMIQSCGVPLLSYGP